MTAGNIAIATVTYEFLNSGLVGTLQVDISGLPAGTDAAVNVSGPGAFDQDPPTTTTIPNLVHAFYDVVAGDVTVDGLTYSAAVTGASSLVLQNATNTVSVSYQPVVPNDGDAASNPGMSAQFRVTAGAPVWGDGLIFNTSSTRIDTKGIQLRDELGDPADPVDFINFRVVHVQAPTTSIAVTLEGGSDAIPGPIRAELRTLAGAKIGQSVLRDTARTIAVANSGGAGEYVMHVVPVFSQPYYTDYVLSMDTYCGATCNFQPYNP